MSCERYEEMLSALLDGELTEEEHEELERHMESCPDCRALYAAFTAVSETMRADREDVPEGLHGLIMAAVEKTEKSRRRAKIVPYLRRYGAMAAVFALIVAAVIALPRSGLGRAGSASSSSNTSASAPASYNYSASTSTATTSSGSASVTTAQAESAAMDTAAEDALEEGTPESAPEPQPADAPQSTEEPVSVLESLELDVWESEITTRSGDTVTTDVLSATDTKVFLYALLMGERASFAENTDVSTIDYTLTVTPEEGEDYTLYFYYDEGRLLVSANADGREAVALDGVESFNAFVKENFE